MTVINTNIKSLVSQNAMVKNNRDLSNAMQQLSTGKRINSAKDDAAGLAISSRMTSQITGLNQAIRNGNDSVSMLQTTEGAMIEMTNMLQRMRELAVQSSNDTYTDIDRGYLDLEFQQLKAEVNRITKQTEWNGMPVMNGTVKNDDNTLGKFDFQIGANAGQIISHTIADMGFRADIDLPKATYTEATVAGDSVSATKVAQKSELVISGRFVVGDKIELKFGNNTAVSYTVVAADLSSEVEATIHGAIATKIAALTMGTDLTAAVSGSKVTITGKNDGTAFATALNFPKATPVAPLGVLQNISQSDIKSNDGSDKSIVALDVAINRINSERAGIGAVINRLTYAADNLANVSQNTSESRSRIMDADYAKASSELARTQIISQAATAMLAQANQQPQTVLQLLQG
jgi:flagellin